MSWWESKPVAKYSEAHTPSRHKVIEVSVSRQLDPEGIKAIPTLAHHPGFVALMGKLHLQRAALETKLKTTHFPDIREVDRIQGAIYWCNWLEATVRSEVFKA